MNHIKILASFHAFVLAGTLALPPIAPIELNEEPFSNEIADEAYASSFSRDFQVLSVPELSESQREALPDIIGGVEAIQIGGSYDIEATIALAESEIGTSRPTGWSQDGECIVSVGRWLRAGGADIAGVDPRHNYIDFIEVSPENVQPGDVMQYEYLSDPTAWASGVHTLLIVGVNGDGTFQIIESNNPGGSGYVSRNDNWTPTPPSGFRAVFWRYMPA